MPTWSTTDPDRWTDAQREADARRCLRTVYERSMPRRCRQEADPDSPDGYCRLHAREVADA